jgi:hypothetical protein
MDETSKQYGVELTSMEDFANKFIERLKVDKCN